MQCNVHVVIADGFHTCHPDVAPYVCCASGAALVSPENTDYCPSFEPSPAQDSRCRAAKLTDVCTAEGLNCEFTFSSAGSKQYPPNTTTTTNFTCCGGAWLDTSTAFYQPCSDCQLGLTCTLPAGHKLTCGADHAWAAALPDAGMD
jgi:hypothetical protein